MRDFLRELKKEAIKDPSMAMMGAAVLVLVTGGACFGAVALTFAAIQTIVCGFCK